MGRDDFEAPGLHAEGLTRSSPRVTEVGEADDGQVDVQDVLEKRAFRVVEDHDKIDGKRCGSQDPKRKEQDGIVGIGAHATKESAITARGFGTSNLLCVQSVINPSKVKGRGRRPKSATGLCTGLLTISVDILARPILYGDAGLRYPGGRLAMAWFVF